MALSRKLCQVLSTGSKRLERDALEGYKRQMDLLCTCFDQITLLIATGTHTRTGKAFCLSGAENKGFELLSGSTGH